MLVERKASCHAANAYLSRLELIWLIKSVQKRFFAKRLRVSIVSLQIIDVIKLRIAKATNL